MTTQEKHSGPTCKTCGFYENKCPFIRGKFIPYPSRVCKDYTDSTMKAQEMLAADLEKAADDYVMQTASGTAEEMETLIDVFKAGASTIIEQRISLGYLISWYIQSVDGLGQKSI